MTFIHKTNLFVCVSVWHLLSFLRYTESTTVCSSYFLPAGGMCPQTEGFVGKRPFRYDNTLFTCFSSEYYTGVVIKSSVDYIYFIYFFILFILRLLSAPSPCHNLCTKFLLPTSGPGSGHQMWHPGGPFQTDQQQLRSDEPGLVCSLNIWVHAAEWSCQTSMSTPASDPDCSCQVKIERKVQI